MTMSKQIKRYFEESHQKEDVEVFKIKVNPNRFLAIKRKKDDFKQKNKPQKSKKFKGKAPIDPTLLEKHSRGEELEGKGVRHPLYLDKLRKKEKTYKFAQEQAARAEILLTEEQGCVEVDKYHKTTSVNQKVIAENVDIAAATKIFDLNLNDFGPYRAKYSRNGRQLLLGGKKGHVAAFDWVTKKLHCEINVMESIHDISWLHVDTMFAVAQKEWTYIYDKQGIELHCLKKLDRVLRLEFLPYHFLLAAVNEFGYTSWLDISVGEMVACYNNKQGRTTVMTQNPYNATLCIGNTKGVVSIWSPTVKEPLAKILCHKTAVTSAIVDQRGLYMATSGADRSLKVWDIRNLDGPLQDYRLRSAPIDLSFSQKGMLALALDEVVEIYNNCCAQTTEKPYLRHRMAKMISNLRFCPYEDVLGVGTSRGFTSIIVPGSGEPNFDALESNPFETTKQRREAEVKALLDKIPADLITLDPFEVVQVDVDTLQQSVSEKEKLKHVKPKTIDFTPRKKKKGKTAIARKKIIKEAAKKELISKELEAQLMQKDPEEVKKPVKSYGVLDRFVSKTK